MIDLLAAFEDFSVASRSARGEMDVPAPRPGSNFKLPHVPGTPQPAHNTGACFCCLLLFLVHWKPGQVLVGPSRASHFPCLPPPPHAASYGLCSLLSCCILLLGSSAVITDMT